MMTPEQCLAQLGQQTLPGFVFCYGEEPQRLQDVVDALIVAARQSGYEERQTLFVESPSDWEQVWQAYRELSLFASQRVLEVHLATKVSAAQSEQLRALLTDPNPEVLLLLRATVLERAAQEAKWVKAWDARGWVVNARALTAGALMAWLRGRARQLGLMVEDDALTLLAEWSEGNLMAAVQSLVRWQLQGMQRVTLADLQADRQDWARYDVFALSDAIESGDVRHCLQVLSRLQEEGEDAVLVLWVLTRELRLWQDVLRVMATHPWSQVMSDFRLWRDRADRLRRLLSRMTPQQVADWLAQALAVDLCIKGQRAGDPWLLLRSLALAMASQGVCELSGRVAH